MTPSVLGIINDGVGIYAVTRDVRSYEGQEGVQHLILVSNSSIYAVTLFGRGRSAV